MKFIDEILISHCNVLEVSVFSANLTTYYHETSLRSATGICKHRLQKMSCLSGSPSLVLPLEICYHKCHSLKGFLLLSGETERPTLADVISHRMCQLYKTPLATPPEVPCCQSVTVPGACRCVLPHAALCCCAPQCLQALSPSLLSVCQLRSEPPALLRCAEELLLGTAASL